MMNIVLGVMITLVAVLVVSYLNVLQKTKKYIQQYVAVPPRETTLRHMAIVTKVYAFCPHCFSTDVYCDMQHGVLRQWHCRDCGQNGPVEEDSLSALMCWHRKHYLDNTAKKIGQRHEQIGN